MITKYQVTYGEEINEVFAERETDKCIWLNGQRTLKNGGYKYFDTRQEAKDYLVTKYAGKVADAQERLSYLESCLEKAQKL